MSLQLYGEMNLNLQNLMEIWNDADVTLWKDSSLGCTIEQPKHISWLGEAKLI